MPKPYVPKAFRREPRKNAAPFRNPERITLYGRIQEILREPSTNINAPAGALRIDDAANSYVRAMESGSFVHLKEVIDREMGKVPQRIADADGGKVKMYIGMPTDDDDAP